MWWYYWDCWSMTRVKCWWKTLSDKPSAGPPPCCWHQNWGRTSLPPPQNPSVAGGTSNAEGLGSKSLWEEWRHFPHIQHTTKGQSRRLRETHTHAHAQTLHLLDTHWCGACTCSFGTLGLAAPCVCTTPWRTWIYLARATCSHPCVCLAGWGDYPRN